MNPFSIKTYKGPEYFIDRKVESRKIIDAIESDRNLTLFSHRRFGKTMLIKHVFSKLDYKTYEPIFVDLFATRNFLEFAQKLTEVLYDNKILQESGLHKIMGSLGVSLTFDPLSGIPQVNFNLANPENVVKGLPQLFRSVSDLKKNVVIAFDEFQEVANYEEKNAEATLRGMIQSFPEITFLFSGSKKSLMKEIFLDANRPFFQSTQMMELHEIDRENYAQEVFSILKKNKKPFEMDVIYKILDLTYCHTGFTQMVLSRIYSESENSIDQEALEHVWSDIMEDHKSMAREQEFVLSRQQWKILVAIACEDYVLEPQSRAFIFKYELPAPSSIARIVRSLLEKGLIIESGEKGLRLFNVYIQRNLQAIYGKAG